MESGLKFFDDVIDYARQVIELEGNAIVDVAAQLDSQFSDAVLCIAKRCRSGGCVIVTGIGKAGLIGNKISATMSSTGTRSFFLHPSEAIHGDLGRVTADDVILVLSQSGETVEIVRLLPTLRKLGAAIIAITASPQSSLGQAADTVIAFGKLQEADTLGLAPSTSTAVMLALGDALALTASRLYGFRREDFAVFHPGGSLGRNLSLVDDYMRPLEKCRFAKDEQTLREVLSQKSDIDRYSGAVMLISGDNKLSGIFTDSDLRRLIGNHREELLDQPVQNVMTANPKRIQNGSSILDAIAILTNLKISELPVVDAENHPVGLIDITDILGVFPELLQERKQQERRMVA
ncbi:MAG: KpsF/GutQ family sugar-phosphate isomerase [Planctomycetaceae bacterium]|jgi:arabinose-5-phosphate isomerase|nr:KpsF/GutQ family sugar-phosphate isomerase [Planctomycetaceae bacterium]